MATRKTEAAHAPARKTAPKQPEPLIDDTAGEEEPVVTLEEAVHDLEDIDHSNDPDVVSAAPPRPHAMVVAQLQIRFDELIDFVRGLEGEMPGELGELLTFVRAKIATRT